MKTKKQKKKALIT